MGEKTLCFVDRKCEVCEGEGCEACEGTGIAGRIEEREVTELHPDGVSRALEARRIAQRMSFRTLGDALGVSVARASQLCRGAGEKRSYVEAARIGGFLREDILAGVVALSFAQLGNGCIRCAQDFVSELADRMEDVRREKPLSEKYQALLAIDSAYHAFELAVERGNSMAEREAALELIIAALRFLSVEYVHECAG